MFERTPARFLLLAVISSLFLVSSPAPGQSSIDEFPDPCRSTIETYMQDNNAFQSLSTECKKQAGVDPRATLENCPGVDRDLFHSLVTKLEQDETAVCQQCQSWPRMVLGPGSCSSD